MRSTGSGASSLCRCAHILQFSRETTRGSLRSFHESWLVPTSKAYTLAAPRLQRASQGEAAV